MCWVVYPLLWSYIPEVDLLPPICAGAAVSVGVSRRNLGNGFGL